MTTLPLSRTPLPADQKYRGELEVRQVRDCAAMPSLRATIPNFPGIGYHSTFVGAAAPSAATMTRHPLEME